MKFLVVLILILSFALLFTVELEITKKTKEKVILKTDTTNRSEEQSLPEDFSNMVFVQGGTFQMGSNNGDRDEKPVHSVTVSDFYIGKYEITQKEWGEIMHNNPARFKKDDKPVERVSWYDAVEFCNKKSSAEGLTPCYTGNGENIKCNFSANGYRLPTEAEWEFAARGGTSASHNNRNKGYKYSGSNDLESVAWYISNMGRKTHPVGKKKPNELGIYDMSGNVWEWCNDWKGHYSNISQTNPRGPSSGSYHICRGGSWRRNAWHCRVANRHFTPILKNQYLGFRLSCNSK